MSDKRRYNGLRNGPAPFGGQVHDLGANRQAAVQAALSQQMNLLMREIYVRVVASWLSADRGVEYCEDSGIDPEEDCRELAKRCESAAQQYFVGLGVIEMEKPDPKSEPVGSLFETPPTNEA